MRPEIERRDAEELPRGALRVEAATADGPVMHVLCPGEELEAGRDADLVLADDPRLHRRAARFTHSDGHWWLVNIGRRLVLELADVDTQSATRLTPGSQVALTGVRSTVRLVLGERDLVMQVTQSATQVIALTPGTDTEDLRSLPLTDDQRLLLLALCEPQLRTPGGIGRLPTNEQARARLAWPQAKFNRKLDNVCDRFAAAGVPGVAAATGAKNTQRRQRLVEAVLAQGMITARDLTLLDDWVALMRERGNLPT